MIRAWNCLLCGLVPSQRVLMMTIAHQNKNAANNSKPVTSVETRLRITEQHQITSAITILISRTLLITIFASVGSHAYTASALVSIKVLMKMAESLS